MDLSAAFQIQPGEVIAITGGGGKSSAMFRLGLELARAGRRVLLTTTTRIFAAQIGQAPAHVAFNPAAQTLPQIIPRLEAALVRHNQVLLIGAADPAAGKAFGVAPETVDALAQSGLVEVIINEADGSRMRPFKAPAAHEPVIPAATTLVIPTVGLDALGRPLTDQFVHRAALVSELGQIPLESPITPALIAHVLAHPAGGLKRLPPAARAIPLLNKLDLVAPETAQTLARLILQTVRIDSVAVGSVNWAGPIGWVENRVAAVVLAAGEASRFGSPKQVALWRGQPMLARVVDAALASQAGPVVAVLGANAAACREALGDRPVTVTVNEAWAGGQSASMQAGLAALPQNVSAAIFLLADQPLVTAGDVDAVIARYRQTLAPVVWPEFEGRRGNPVLFDRRLFPEMRAVTGDVGARPVLLAHQSAGEGVAVANPGILKDVDTPADLEG